MQSWSEEDRLLEVKKAIGYITGISNGSESNSVDYVEYAKLRLSHDCKHEERLLCWFINCISKRMPKKCEECGDWYREKIMEKVQVKCAVCNIANHGCKPNSVKAWLCGECVNFMIDTENNIVKRRGRSILDIVRDDLVENTKDLIGNTKDHNAERGTDVGTMGDTKGNTERGEITDVNARRNEELKENEAEANGAYNSGGGGGREMSWMCWRIMLMMMKMGLQMYP